MGGACARRAGRRRVEGGRPVIEGAEADDVCEGASLCAPWFDGPVTECTSAALTAHDSRRPKTMSNKRPVAHCRRARPGIACRTSFCWCGSMNCVKIRVKNEKLRDSVMRSAGGSGSNRACGLNTRLKNCEDTRGGRHSRARVSEPHAHGKPRNASRPQAPLYLKPPPAARRGAALRRVARARPRRTATWRATAASNTGGSSKSAFGGCCFRPACRAMSSFAPARAAA